MLEENDHDFVFHVSDSGHIGQLTEIVSFDYLRETAEENHNFSNYVMERGTLLGVDDTAKDALLLSKIQKKLAKHYAKLDLPMWLIIWTTRSDFVPLHVEKGIEIASPSLQAAWKWLESNSSQPFDEIWFVHLNGFLFKVWPRTM